jgi:hypothetical protein
MSGDQDLTHHVNVLTVHHLSGTLLIVAKKTVLRWIEFVVVVVRS